MASFIDELRAMRAAVLEHTVKELPVPPTGTLTLRLRAPNDPDALLPVIASYRANGALGRDQATQLLVDCCDEILQRNDQTGELESMPDGPLRFDAGDERWGNDVNTARECVAKLYNLDKQPAVLAGICDVVMDWLQGVDAAVVSQVKDAGKAGAASSS